MMRRNRSPACGSLLPGIALPISSIESTRSIRLLPSRRIGMSKEILGLHHVTAIASDPQRNLDFYTDLLGLRLVKLTVNYDDPGTYHLYFGDETGSPGTILTFFPWPNAPRGQKGTGQAVATSFSISETSIEYWT